MATRMKERNLQMPSAVVKLIGLVFEPLIMVKPMSVAREPDK